MTISVIFTGGTIGSLTKNEWVGIDASAKYMLLNRFSHADDVVFDTVEPYSVLSENLSAAELNRLQDAVQAELQKRPDGIIITHGTDTLQYAAAAIEFAFADAALPIVFVSADYPLDNDRSNGHINFEAAVGFIRHSGAKGVFVSYKNQNRDTVDIHMASRLRQHAESSANLYSLGDSVCATYNGALTVCRTIDAADTAALGVVPYTDDAAVLTIESVPGNRYAYALDGVKAILLKPYHSATLNTQSAALEALCQRAHTAGIPVIVAGVPSGGGYESSQRFDDLHIHVAPYSGFAALYMKLWAAVSLGRDILSAVDTPIAHEIVL